MKRRLPGKRPLLISGAAIAFAAVVGAIWVLAAVFQSPAQQEANASAPPRQPVFAEVTFGTLADQRSYSGTVTFSNEAGFTLPAAAEAARSVVTAEPPSVGSTVTSGDVLTEVNTRPVHVVASPFPFFRDIGFGDQGADVRVLQEALVNSGYLAGADGTYGAQTAQAIARWYQDAGYKAPTRPRPLANASSRASETSKEPGSEVAADSAATSELDAMLDPFVPVSELLAVPSLPATIITAPAVGALVGGEDTTDLTLGTSPLIARAEVPVADSAGITPGDRVTVVAAAGQLDAVVAGVDEQPPGEDGTPRPSLMAVSLEPDSAVAMSGRGEAVTVQVLNAIVADETLIVPTSAVVGRGNGRGVVVKRQADGSLIEVSVIVTGSLRGMTAVAPDKADVLAEGDDVRVG